MEQAQRPTGVTGIFRRALAYEGFNEPVTFWHCDHYFHHHPITILALWLILFMAHLTSFTMPLALGSFGIAG